MLTKAAKWCPEPLYVNAGGISPALAPPLVLNADAVAAAAASAAAASTPGWGWGAKGWDAPGNALGPKTQGAAGGVEASAGLIPSMPPHLRHLFVVSEPNHKADALRRCIHALDTQRALVFMNFQQRLQDTIFKLEARGMAVSRFDEGL